MGAVARKHGLAPPIGNFQWELLAPSMDRQRFIGNFQWEVASRSCKSQLCVDFFQRLCHAATSARTTFTGNFQWEVASRTCQSNLCADFSHVPRCFFGKYICHSKIIIAAVAGVFKPAGTLLRCQCDCVPRLRYRCDSEWRAHASSQPAPLPM